ADARSRHAGGELARAGRVRGVGADARAAASWDRAVMQGGERGDRGGADRARTVRGRGGRGAAGAVDRAVGGDWRGRAGDEWGGAGAALAGGGSRARRTGVAGGVAGDRVHGSGGGGS